MNWDAIGSLGEIVGAAGVIGSLLYLAIQTKKASLATNSQTADAWTGEYNRLLLQAGDKDFSELFVRGLADFDQLGKEEKMRFHTWMAAHLLSCQTSFRQIEFGTTDKTTADNLLAFNAMMLKTEGGRTWWNHFKVIQSPEFQIAMDKKIDEVQPITDIWPWFSAKA